VLGGLGFLEGWRKDACGVKRTGRIHGEISSSYIQIRHVGEGWLVIPLRDILATSCRADGNIVVSAIPYAPGRSCSLVG